MCPLKKGRRVVLTCPLQEKRVSSFFMESSGSQLDLNCLGLVYVVPTGMGGVLLGPRERREDRC